MGIMAPRDEKLALSSGTRLAGMAITHFDDCYEMVFLEYKDQIFESIIKTVKFTSVHYMLHYFQDISREIKELSEGMEDNELVFNFIKRTLQEIKIEPPLPEPEFYNCDDVEGHFDCKCGEIVQSWIEYVELKQDTIDNLIVHSAFQIIFQDRNFLRTFHLRLSEFVEVTIDELKLKYPESITNKGRIKRGYFPKWLTSAIFYRDKATCVMAKCRRDLSNLLRTQNKINIDHIVPLDSYGTNDASNLQLLCEVCNLKKSAKSADTSTINVPYWNLYD